MLEGGNAHRLEEADEARALNNKLKKIWMSHSRFDEVRSTKSFLRKIEIGAEKATKMLRAIQAEVEAAAGGETNKKEEEETEKQNEASKEEKTVNKCNCNE